MRGFVSPISYSWTIRQQHFISINRLRPHSTTSSLRDILCLLSRWKGRIHLPTFTASPFTLLSLPCCATALQRPCRQPTRRRAFRFIQSNLGLSIIVSSWFPGRTLEYCFVTHADTRANTCARPSFLVIDDDISLDSHFRLSSTIFVSDDLLLEYENNDDRRLACNRCCLNDLFPFRPPHTHNAAPPLAVNILGHGRIGLAALRRPRRSSPRGSRDPALRLGCALQDY